MNVKDKETKITQVKISKNKSIPIIIVSLCFYLVAIFLWQQEKIDTNIIINQNYFFSHIFLIQAAKFISRYGMGFICLLLAIQLKIFQSKDGNKADQPIFFYIIISFAAASITGDLLKEIIDRARPVVELSNQILQTEINDSPSFPSGHATKSMALALSFMLMMSNSNKITVVNKTLTLIVAILVCYSRVVLQKHYLSDVLAGIGTALFFLVPSVVIVNLIFKYRDINEHNLHSHNNKIALIFLALSVVLTMM